MRNKGQWNPPEPDSKTYAVIDWFFQTFKYRTLEPLTLSKIQELGSYYEPPVESYYLAEVVHAIDDKYLYHLAKQNQPQT